MIVVLDTNVIVAALVAKGLCHEIVVRALGGCTVVTSTALLDELEHTLRGIGPLGMPACCANPAGTAIARRERQEGRQSLAAQG